MAAPPTSHITLDANIATDSESTVDHLMRIMREICGRPPWLQRLFCGPNRQWWHGVQDLVASSAQNIWLHGPAESDSCSFGRTEVGERVGTWLGVRALNGSSVYNVIYIYILLLYYISNNIYIIICITIDYRLYITNTISNMLLPYNIVYCSKL